MGKEEKGAGEDKKFVVEMDSGRGGTENILFVSFRTFFRPTFRPNVVVSL